MRQEESGCPGAASARAPGFDSSGCEPSAATSSQPDYDADAHPAAGTAHA